MSFDPTKAELEILQLIWQYGPSTVRFINDKLNEERDVTYTSTLKQMQIMFEKKILRRDESQMKHVYFSSENEQKAKGYLLDKFIDNMFKGSPSNMMMQLLGNKSATKDELMAIRSLIDQFEEE